MMNVEQKAELIECCKLMIDVSRNHEEVMIARIALASLTAEPMIWHNGDITDLLAEGNIAAHRTGTHVMPLYPAPPVPVMKAVKPPKPMRDNWPGISYTAGMAFDQQDELWKAALREAGIQIEGEE
jgi:hypothetical protein